MVVFWLLMTLGSLSRVAITSLTLFLITFTTKLIFMLMKALLGAIVCALSISSLSSLPLAAQTEPTVCQQTGFPYGRFRQRPKESPRPKGKRPPRKMPRHCGRHQACAGVPRLKVVGTRLLNEKGDSVVLNGPSLGWHSNWGRFYNDSTVMAFRRNWDANITRAAIGAHTSGDVVNCFDADSVAAMSRLYKVIDAAITYDMYIICDWHSHNNTLPDAKRFFKAVTERYGNCPNIIYEIWNEPLEIPWQEIKDYAEVIIPLIREKAPDSVIIVGTPKWDQDVDIAAESPLDFPNLLYALHFYASTHGDWFREKAEKAIAAGLPLIISECGGMEATGDGPLGEESWGKWMDLADRHGLSVLMWAIADKNETCSMVTPDASSNAMHWTDAQLKPWAKMARATIKRRNAPAPAKSK